MTRAFFLWTTTSSLSDPLLVSSCFPRITASLIVTMCQRLVSPLECSSKASEHPYTHTHTPSRDLTWAAVVLSPMCPSRFINISGEESLKCAVSTVTYRCILGWRISGVRVWNGCATASFVRVWETQHTVLNKYNMPVFISNWLYLDYELPRHFEVKQFIRELSFKSL